MIRLNGFQQRKTPRWFISGLLLLILIFAGCTSQAPPSSGPDSEGTPPDSTSGSVETPENATAGSLGGIEASLEAIYTETNPSVVNIQVVFPGGGGQGSGFVWDSQGNIVTNNHVVEDASRITVNFYDGTSVEASLVGTDPDSDLAVIELDTNSVRLQPVTMADSTQLKVGQLAIAIGNPFGLQGTMTVGIISGLGRLLPTSQDVMGANYSIPDIIQTDAAINPGNSGGALLDSNGEVIGVTSSIATTSGTFVGVGFAIPSAIVQQVVPSLIATGHYDHPYLGISVISLSPGIAEAMNLPSDQRGALIEDVTAGSPADEAGLQAGQTEVTIDDQQIILGGDVVIAYDGQPVQSSDDLVTFLARYGSVGQTVTLDVLRDGEQIQVQATLGARPSS